MHANSYEQQHLQDEPTSTSCTLLLLLLSLVPDELVLPMLPIKRTRLEPAQLESEAWTQLLKVGALERLLKLVAMMPYKDKVALIVKGAHSTTFELWPVRKQRAQKPSDAVAQPGREIVQDNL